MQEILSLLGLTVPQHGRTPRERKSILYSPQALAGYSGEPTLRIMYEGRGWELHPLIRLHRPAHRCQCFLSHNVAAPVGVGPTLSAFFRIAEYGLAYHLFLSVLRFDRTSGYTRHRAVLDKNVFRGLASLALARLSILGPSIQRPVSYRWTTRLTAPTRFELVPEGPEPSVLTEIHHGAKKYKGGAVLLSRGV